MGAGEELIFPDWSELGRDGWEWDEMGWEWDGMGWDGMYKTKGKERKKEMCKECVNVHSDGSGDVFGVLMSFGSVLQVGFVLV